MREDDSTGHCVHNDGALSNLRSKSRSPVNVHSLISVKVHLVRNVNIILKLLLSKNEIYRGLNGRMCLKQNCSLQPGRNFGLLYPLTTVYIIISSVQPSVRLSVCSSVHFSY